MARRKPQLLVAGGTIIAMSVGACGSPASQSEPSEVPQSVSQSAESPTPSLTPSPTPSVTPIADPTDEPAPEALSVFGYIETIDAAQLAITDRDPFSARYENEQVFATVEQAASTGASLDMVVDVVAEGPVDGTEFGGEAGSVAIRSSDTDDSPTLLLPAEAVAWVGDSGIPYGAIRGTFLVAKDENGSYHLRQTDGLTSASLEAVCTDSGFNEQISAATKSLVSDPSPENYESERVQWAEVGNPLVWRAVALTSGLHHFDGVGGDIFSGTCMKFWS